MQYRHVDTQHSDNGVDDESYISALDIEALMEKGIMAGNIDAVNGVYRH